MDQCDWWKYIGIDGENEPVIADDMLPSLWDWARLCWLGGRPGWGVCCVTNNVIVIVIDIVIVINAMVMVLYDCWLGGRSGWGICCVPYILRIKVMLMRRIMMKKKR